MKFIITGPTCSGKAKLAKILETNGLSILEPYVTQEPDDKHNLYFKVLANEQELQHPDKICLMTDFGPPQFTTSQDVESADVMILNPDAMFQIIELFPEHTFVIIHMQIGDETAAADIYAKRFKNQDDAKRKYTEIQQAEKSQFNALTDKIDALINNKSANANCRLCATFINQYDPKAMHQLAAKLLSRKKIHDNLKTIVYQCVNLGIFSQDKTGKAVVVVENNNNAQQVSLSDDVLTTVLLTDAENMPNGLSDMLMEWLGYSIKIGTPSEIEV